ncbi:MAG: hypothetical protein K8S00_02635 [Bacteroidales bacterium]|nr:hypothetical protein [Bacteroidales bacterium]
MKKQFFLLVTIFLTINCFPGQPDSISIINDQDLHRLIQLKGTNEIIKDYFTNNKIVSNSDYIIAIILPPMGCPRCEGLISPFLKDVNKFDSTLNTAIFVFYSKSKPIYQYLKDRKYPADDFYIFTNNDFLGNFYFSSVSLQVPYFAKFNIKTGDLVLSKSTLGLDYNSDVGKSFVDAKSPCEKYDKDIGSPLSIQNKTLSIRLNLDSLSEFKNNFLSNYRIFTVKEDENFLLSEIRRISFSEDLKYISFMDDLTNSICVYSKHDEYYTLVRNIRAGEYEDKLFFDKQLGDAMFKFLKGMNIINSMYFNSEIFGDSVIISTSLPEVFYEDVEAEKIAYINKIVFLIRNIYNADFSSYITLDTNFSIVSFEHTNARFFPENDKIIIPVSKGWPVSGTGSVPKNDPLENPFISEFYNFTPGFAQFDMSGKFQKFIGSIDTIYAFYKLGYTYFKPLVKFYDSSYWLADSYAGTIRKYDINKGEYSNKEAVLFSIPEIQKKLITAQEGTLEYIKSFNAFLNNYIIDFVVLDNEVLSLVKSGSYYLLLRYSFIDNKILDQKIIPNKISDYNCNSLHIKKIGNKALVLGAYESDLESVIVEFDCN